MHEKMQDGIDCGRRRFVTNQETVCGLTLQRQSAARVFRVFERLHLLPTLSAALGLQWAPQRRAAVTDGRTFAAAVAKWNTNLHSYIF